MKPETRFRNALRNQFKQYFEVMQIESGDTSPGVPDTHLLLKHTNLTCWFELKHELELPKRIELEKTQYVWLRRYHRNDGKCFVVLKVEDLSEIYVWEGCHAKELYDGKDIYNIPHVVFNTRRYGWHNFVDYMQKQIVLNSRTRGAA